MSCEPPLSMNFNYYLPHSYYYPTSDICNKACIFVAPLYYGGNSLWPALASAPAGCRCDRLDDVLSICGTGRAIICLAPASMILISRRILLYALSEYWQQMRGSYYYLLDTDEPVVCSQRRLSAGPTGVQPAAGLGDPSGGLAVAQGGAGRRPGRPGRPPEALDARGPRAAAGAARLRPLRGECRRGALGAVRLIF
eukprot:scaffold387990_cov25-Prasinocladus_malaysianus.AAC.1